MEGAVVVHVLGMTRLIPMILFSSSSIVAGGYDARSGTLRLRYIGGLPIGGELWLALSCSK